MLRRIGSHIRNQWIGVLALFVALGGSAYAAATIGSADIIDGSIASVDVKNGQITKDDLASDAVRTGKVLDESLTGHDIQDNTIGGADVNESLLDPLTGGQIKANSLTGGHIQDNTIGGVDISESLTDSEIQDESLTGHDIQDDTIGGADVNESLLDPLTNAQIQDESLTGHDIQDNTIGGADVNESLLNGVPYASTFASHDPADVTLPASGTNTPGAWAQVIYTGDHTGDFGETGGAVLHVTEPGRVYATTSLSFHPNQYGTVFGRVECQFGLVRAGVPNRRFGQPTLSGIDNDLMVSLSAATVVNNPGDYFVNVECRDQGTSTGGRLLFARGNLMAWVAGA
jgi:hypothetical protein